MLAIIYSMKKEIKVAKWGTPKKYFKKKSSTVENTIILLVPSSISILFQKKVLFVKLKY